MIAADFKNLLQILMVQRIDRKLKGDFNSLCAEAIYGHDCFIECSVQPADIVVPIPETFQADLYRLKADFGQPVGHCIIDEQSVRC